MASMAASRAALKDAFLDLPMSPGLSLLKSSIELATALLDEIDLPWNARAHMLGCLSLSNAVLLVKATNETVKFP